ncbi:hypothetical protein [Haloquadratum walsbyi]
MRGGLHLAEGDQLELTVERVE